MGRRWPRASLLRTVTVLFVVFALAAPVIAAGVGPRRGVLGDPGAGGGDPRRGAAGVLAVGAPPAERTLPRRAGWVAVPCLVALGLGCVLLPAGSGLAYRGGLPLIGMSSAGLISALQADGPLRRVLAWRPLVAVGLVSYGLYLYHWPVFVLVDRQRWDLPFWPCSGVKVAITAVADDRLVLPRRAADPRRRNACRRAAHWPSAWPARSPSRLSS